MLRLFILHLLIKDSLVVAPNVKLCKVIDKVNDNDNDNEFISNLQHI